MRRLARQFQGAVEVAVEEVAVGRGRLPVRSAEGPVPEEAESARHAQPGRPHDGEDLVVVAVKAPSPNIRRNRLGMRNATTKASANMLAPMSAAKSCSRIKPKSRLSMVAAEMSPAALARTRFFGALIAGDRARAGWA